MFHRLGNFIITLLVLLFVGVLIVTVVGGAIAIAVTLIKIVFPIISILLGFLILLGIVCIIIYINI